MGFSWEERKEKVMERMSLGSITMVFHPSAECRHKAWLGYFFISFTLSYQYSVGHLTNPETDNVPTLPGTQMSWFGYCFHSNPLPPPNYPHFCQWVHKSPESSVLTIFFCIEYIQPLTKLCHFFLLLICAFFFITNVPWWSFSPHLPVLARTLPPAYNWLKPIQVHLCKNWMP